MAATCPAFPRLADSGIVNLSTGAIVTMTADLCGFLTVLVFAQAFLPELR